MTKKCENRERETRESGVVSKLVSQRILSIVIHVLFIPAHGKRLYDPSGLSPDDYLCFRVPGTSICRFFIC